MPATTANGRANLVLGALQGPSTFGGEAGRRFIELYPELFSELVFFDTAEAALAFEDGRADASCAPQQMTRTGFHPGIQSYIARHGSALHVIAEVTHAYHCSLLVKPGSPVTGVKRVLGHTGSVTQCRHWIEQHIPGAEIVIVDTSSMDAARAVVNGDGSTASIGTPAMAAEFALDEAHKEIDGGSVGSYWAISPKPLFSEAPTRVVVAGRFSDDGRLTDVVCALAAVGYRLDTVFTSPSGQRLFEYDDVLRFSGAGRLAELRSAVAPIRDARLAGAFVAKE